jgi:hypothetical protein
MNRPHYKKGPKNEMRDQNSEKINSGTKKLFLKIGGPKLNV